jgi:hypothetical protein
MDTAYLKSFSCILCILYILAPGFNRPQRPTGSWDE